MKPKKPAPKQLLPYCAEVHEDDGVDPREFFKAGKPRRKADRKTAQLCQQVAEVLSYVLSGNGRDNMLQDLQVISVVPAPDATQLLVTVGPALQPTQPLDRIAILGRLEEAKGRLRGEVASSICRKRVPQLLFNLVGYAGGTEPAR